MRKLISRAICLLLYIVLALQMSALPAAASTDGMSVSVEYYGREALSKLPNSTALLYAYDRITEGVEASKESFSIYDERNPISVEEMETVLSAYRSDRADHFWLGNSVRYSYSSAKATVVDLMPTYIMSGSELETARGVFDGVVNSILSEMENGMSEFETELWLHDRLAETVTYIETENAHNAYGAIVEGKAVCEGYAEALQYLLQLSGIQSFIAVGTGTNSAGATEAHAWNFVRIDGKYYQTDLTWDDHGEKIFHAYFNLSDSEMLRDHTLSPTAYELPVCNSDDAQYFSVMEGRIDGSSYSVSSVASRLKDNGMSASFYITENPDGFIDWFYNNIRDIASEAGIVGAFTYGYSSAGREVMLTINTCRHTSLTYVPAAPATCTEDGNSTAYYLCSCGKWFADSQAVYEITDKESITLYAKGHDYTEKIEDSAHLKSAAVSCQKTNVYWFDCSRCDSNAKNDVYAYGQYYNSSVYGAHNISSYWVSENGKHAHVCLTSGCDYLEDEAVCSGGTATCMAKAVCSICEKSYGSLAPHDYDLEAWGYTSFEGHAHACKEEGCEAHGDIVTHTAGAAATNEAPQLCTECEYIIVPAGHFSHEPNEKWERDITHHWRDCEGCEAPLDMAEHEYSDEWSTDKKSHWRECFCGAITKVGEHFDSDGNGMCDTCNYTLSSPAVTTQRTQSSPSETTPFNLKTIAIVSICAAACIGTAAIVGVLCRKKKR